MERRPIAREPVIIAVLILQLIPLVLFPPKIFAQGSQEFWLPALLALMVLIADFALIVRHTVNLWPWYLISFAQGFNMISRLMIVFPSAVQGNGGATYFNALYVGLTLVAVVLSGVLLWYTELPDVRMGLLRD